MRRFQSHGHSRLAQLGRRAAPHERGHDLRRRAGTGQHCEDTHTDGHLDTGPSGDSNDGRRGLDAFGHGVTSSRDVLQPKAAGQLLTHPMVAAQRTCAGGDEVAGPGQTEERQRSTPQGDAESRDLGETAGDERGHRVLPIPETRGDTGGDGDHVLHRSSDLASDDVVARVDPQTVAGQEALDRGCRPAVGKRHAGRRWFTGHDLTRQVRSADHADEPRVVARQLVDDHLGHPQAGLQLESLGGADDEGTRPHPPVRSAARRFAGAAPARRGSRHSPEPVPRRAGRSLRAQRGARSRARTCRCGVAS